MVRSLEGPSFSVTEWETCSRESVWLCFSSFLIVLGMDILVYVAAKCDVQYLVAAAYSHDRQLAVGRQAEQYQVVFIPVGIYILQGGNWFFLHVKRVDIATTAHDQPVQPVHYCRQRFDIR
mgnify:CR=1 FL=1